MLFDTWLRFRSATSPANCWTSAWSCSIRASRGSAAGPACD